jgi:hypothetical protein
MAWRFSIGWGYGNGETAGQEWLVGRSAAGAAVGVEEAESKGIGRSFSLVGKVVFSFGMVEFFCCSS